LPSISNTVAVIVEVPRTVTEMGLASTLTLAGRGASIVTVSVSDKLNVVSLAVTITLVGVIPAVRVTDALPLASVMPVALSSVAALLLKEKFIVEPETADPELFKRFAVKVVVFVVNIVESLALSARVPLGEGTEIVIATEPDRVDTNPVTVTVAAELPAVKVTEACPLLSVVAEGADKVPAELSTEKFTVAPETAAPALSSTVAVIVEVADVRIDSDEAARLILAAVDDAAPDPPLE